MLWLIWLVINIALELENLKKLHAGDDEEVYALLVSVAVINGMHFFY
jgi:hypothetical protein